jgi:hypothetical protein
MLVEEKLNSGYTKVDYKFAILEYDSETRISYVLDMYMMMKILETDKKILSYQILQIG